MKSMAVAYQMKKKKKAMEDAECMAEGGQVKKPAPLDSVKVKDFTKGFNGGYNFAEGGKVTDEDELINRIIAKRYSEGGMVANSGMADPEDLAKYEENEFDLLAKTGGIDDYSYTGKNSGDELGNEREDEDRADIVARVMRSRAKKDRLPNPR